MTTIVVIAICLAIFVGIVATGPRASKGDVAQSFFGFVIEFLTQWWW